MEGEKKAGSSAIHKIVGVIMLFCALIFALQATMTILLSDNDRIELIRGGAKMYRESANSDPLKKATTDEEIEETLASQKDSLLADSKKGNFTLIAMKFLFSFILLVIAVGLFLNKRNPTRTLAAVMTVLLLLGILANLKDLTGQDIYKYVSLSSTSLKLSFFADKATLLTIPLALICCIITLVKPPASPEKPKPV